MQSVIYPYKHINSIFDEFDRFYQLTSERKSAYSLLPDYYDYPFMYLHNIFHNYGNCTYNLAYTNKHFAKLNLPVNNERNVIVCFSGGKDSLSVVKYYMDRKYNVYLFHVKGINKTYLDEWKAVEEIAKTLNLPYHIETVKLKGNHDWIEHPLKNMIIANMAIEYGIKEGIGTTIAFGNFSSSSLDDEPFDVCAGDCKEMWEVYENIIQTIIPYFSINIPNTNFEDTINTIVENPELLPKTISCMTPNRFRNQLRHKNQIKYGFPKMPNRCGSCWKCCLEYCVFADKDILEYDRNYYEHCLKILQNTLYKETKIKYNIKETWNHYFFYDKTFSKFFFTSQ